MAAIGLMGPHAIGKSTAVRRWVQRYRGLVGVMADAQVEATQQGGTVPVAGWKGNLEDKRLLVEQHLAADHVAVIDSARTTAVAYLDQASPVIIVTCTAELMGEFIRARCAKKNKRFRDDCWTPQKLGYESARRYVNFAQKNLHPNQYRVFEIYSQERDWLQVDEYFGSLYRYLHNQIVRQRACLSSTPLSLPTL